MDKEYSLAELRAVVGKRQSDVADAIGVTRESVGNRETRPVGKQSIRGLLDYVDGLGGSLELIVYLDGKKYPLKVDE